MGIDDKKPWDNPIKISHINEDTLWKPKADSETENTKESLIFLMKDLFPQLTMTNKEKIDFVAQNNEKLKGKNFKFDREFNDKNNGALFAVFELPRETLTINCDNDLAKTTLDTRIKLAKQSNDEELLKYIVLHSKEHDVIDPILLNPEAGLWAKLLAVEKASPKWRKEYIMQIPHVDSTIILKIMNVKGKFEYDIIREKRLREYIKENYWDSLPPELQEAFVVEKATQYESWIDRAAPLTDEQRAKLKGF